jgi:phosphoribosylglycinamide formyltransferase-1
MADPRRVAVLISGRGSNLQALMTYAGAYEIVLVASNKPQAPGLDVARSAGLPTWTWDGKSVSRDAFEQALNRSLDDHRVGTIALAGYMRLLSSAFVGRWEGRIVNIHPSLLPKYPGLDTHGRAIAAGDTIAGCTVHLVNEEVDAGRILAQAEVPIDPGDDAASLAQRVLAAEHRLYPPSLDRFVRKGA